ncbi:WD40 repeat-like protein [Artomyces pyxidatus]|uniref:WD40 repeat-like protein n=1 Tax=Artomyces pyxidatus TaxID=48021 RepID=A0ACB8SUG5_9AGAM|nr:WD40 repeat-like protein [Artomyces pyxidatus]
MLSSALLIARRMKKICASSWRVSGVQLRDSRIVQAELIGARTERGVARVEEHTMNNEAAAVLRARSNLINKLPRAHEAGFDSGRAGGPSVCFAGTRVAILNMIKAWMENEDAAIPRVFWLNGLAGIGKSTIARTVAEFAQQRGILGGSFFFVRGDNALSQSRLVFPTLAFQLAQKDIALKSAIGKALEEDADYGHRAAPIQVEKLIIEPLGTLDRSEKLLIFVLDALDECGNGRGAAEILRLLLAHAYRVPFRFRVLITSRPEHHIRSVFSQEPSHARFILHDIEASVVRHDIQLFVHYELVDIPKQLQVRASLDWPRKADIDALVERSGKLFIYAATAIRFIGNTTVRNPQKQIDILLGARHTTKTKPYEDLDLLYLQVLRSALPSDLTDDDDIDRFHWVIGSVVLLRDPLSMDALACFTRFETEEVVNALYHLHSIILTPSAMDEAPVVYHPSFPDFITDPQRCTDSTFTITISIHEQRLTLRCLELIEAVLKRDIAEIKNPSLLNSEVGFFNDKVNKAMPAHVQYACRYWASHLMRVSLGDEAVMAQLNKFASVSMMWWFEAMSLLGATTLAVSCMRDAHRWVADSNGPQDLVTLLYDAYRFIVSHQTVINSSALHVYHTALPFTPHDTALYKTYEKETRDSVRVLQGMPRHWSPCLGTMHGRGDAAKAIAFSPDGLRVAVGLEGNGNIATLWEAQTVTHILTFYGHSGTLRSVAFSPDSSRLATGSDDHTVRVWDTVSGVSVTTFEGHTSPVLSVHYMLDGLRLVSGSSDCTVRVWDTISCTNSLKIQADCVIHSVTSFAGGSRIVSGQDDGRVQVFDSQSGARVATFEGHTEPVLSVAVESENDRSTIRIASGSEDCTIRVWNSSSGACVATLEGHKSEVSSVTFGPLYLGSGSSDATVRLWPKHSLSSTGAITLRGHPTRVNGVAFSPDGSRIASSSDDSTWKLWDAESVASDQTTDWHAEWATSYAMSQDTSWLATGGNDGLVKLWDASTGDLIKDLIGHRAGICSLAFSNDGARLASGSYDGTVRVWGAESGDCLMTLKGHTEYVTNMSFCDSGTQLFSRTDHHTYTWDLVGRALVGREDNQHPLAEPPYPGMVGQSGGDWFWFGQGRFLYMSTPFGGHVRIALVVEEYRLTGFGVQGDRVVFICAGGQVLLMDISRPKLFFSTL